MGTPIIFPIPKPQRNTVDGAASPVDVAMSSAEPPIAAEPHDMTAERLVRRYHRLLLLVATPVFLLLAGLAVWQGLQSQRSIVTALERRAGADHAARGNAVYQYVLTEILPDAGLVALESFHALDVLLLFGPRVQAQAPERALAARMQRAWVDFAYGREPGSSDAIAWPRYRADARQALEFNSARSGLIDDYRREYCAFWNQYAIL